MSVQTSTFKTSYPEWKDEFDYWIEVAGLDIVTAWRLQAKLIAERLIGGIAGGSTWNRATPPGTRKQGEMAMARDIKRSVTALKGDGFRDIKLKKRITVAVREGDIAALQEMVRNGIFGSALVSAKVIPAGNEYTAHNNSRRSRGRVTEKQPKFAVPGDAYLNKYIADGKQAVGEGKGGWVASLNALGGSCGDWISKHAKSGTFEDNLNPKADKLSFRMINRSKWASGGDEDRIIDTVLGDRADAIKADIAYRLENSFKTGKRRTA